jgi:hypothetical protein
MIVVEVWAEEVEGIPVFYGDIVDYGDSDPRDYPIDYTVLRTLHSDTTEWAHIRCNKWIERLVCSVCKPFWLASFTATIRRLEA